MIRGSSASLCPVLQLVDSMSFGELLAGMANTWRLWCFPDLVPGAELSISALSGLCRTLCRQRVVLTPLETPMLKPMEFYEFPLSLFEIFQWHISNHG